MATDLKKVTLADLLEAYCDQEHLDRFEGESGVRNLAKVARAIGYKDELHFGQFASDGAYGDLIRFFEDNPGACEAVYNWIIGCLPQRDTGGNDPMEWKESVAEKLHELPKGDEDDGEETEDA